MNSNNEAREIRTCKKCGTPIEGDVKFCSNCGAPLGENKTSRKKKGHKLLIAAVVILGISILAVIGENGDESTSSKGKDTTGETSVRSTPDKTSDETNQILSDTDLAKYLGDTVSSIESGLDVSLIDMSVEMPDDPKFQNIYRVRQGNTRLFDCVTDENGKIIEIHLGDSGKKGYSLFGVTSKMDIEAATDTWAKNGIEQINESLWQCSNGVDALIRKTDRWVLIHDSQELKEAVLERDARDSFSFQFEDSMGAYYIGNGQIVEYYHDSFAAVVYAYKQATAYQAEALSSELDGRYIVASGQITGVSNKGEIDVLCDDPDAATEGSLFLPMGTASVTIVAAQQNELMNLTTGDTITVVGRFDGQSRGGIFADTFDLYDGIILDINGNKREVPIIEKDIPGLTKFSNQTASSGPSSATGSVVSPSDYIGDWGDSVSQRCYMCIEDWGNNTFGIQINWSSGASNDTQWNMTAQYDSATGELEYSDGTNFDYIYTDDGDVIEDLLYTDGTGKFYLSDGYLHWQDDVEHSGDSCLFEKF